MASNNSKPHLETHTSENDILELPPTFGQEFLTLSILYQQVDVRLCYRKIMKNC